MNDIQNKIDTLKKLGLDDKKILSLIILAQEEFFDQVEDDLLDADDGELEKLSDELPNLDTLNLDPVKSESLLKEYLQKIYGLSYSSKFTSFISEYLDDCIKQADEIKDFFIKYSQNDPDTLKKIIEMQDDPDYLAMKDTIKSVSDL